LISLVDATKNDFKRFQLTIDGWFMSMQDPFSA
jgi:hypothetical protein